MDPNRVVLVDDHEIIALALNEAIARVPGLAFDGVAATPAKTSPGTRLIASPRASAMISWSSTRTTRFGSMPFPGCGRERSERGPGS